MLKIALCGVATSALAISAALAAPEIGAPAPAFEGVASSGETISLEQFRGQPVVLEWTNHDCPAVVKHYVTGNMQAAQSQAVADGAIWISVISSAPGKQGYVEAAEANALTESREARPSYVILDPTGEIGKRYAAKTTPHMFVIDSEGALRYDGAIDDRPSTNPETVEGANNFTLAALSNVMDGRPVDPARTQPYGCSVKYGS
jgi:hypothetical protein